MCAPIRLCRAPAPSRLLLLQCLRVRGFDHGLQTLQ
jgi:hypothetical protein